MNDSEAPTGSPPWGPTTKLVVGLTFVAIIAALLIQFRGIIGPLLLAVVLAYVLHPLSAALSKTTNLSWRSSVNIVFLFLVAVLIILFTLSGLAVIQQLQSLVITVRDTVAILPDLVENLSLDFLEQEYRIGPFFELVPSSFLDLSALSQELLRVVQPLVGRMGNLVGAFASRAGITVVWGLFVLVIAYFVLADAGQGVPEALLSVEIPGYQDDLLRIARELGQIWNAFLRGQLILFVLTVISFQILLSALGMRFAIGLSILAGVARFVPYIGPLTTWIVIVLVAVFQEKNYLGLSPIQYAGLVVLAGFLLDQVFDNLVTPRVMGRSLGVHPAAVLVAAIIAANLMGLVGLLLAAPVLATLRVFGRYAGRKMLDLEPWPEQERQPELEDFDFRLMIRRVINRFRSLRRMGENHVERDRGSEDRADRGD